MNTIHIESKQAHESAKLPLTSDSFDFDTWAGAVKRQMIASLRKRGDYPAAEPRSNDNSNS